MRFLLTRVFDYLNLTKGAIVKIKDQGPGIPKENLGRIFERFYTYRPEEKSFGNNSGLGLSICKQIIKSLNGTIIATNRLEGGSVFTVTLPLNKDRKRKKWLVLLS